ncbi:hypothetical protein [Streptomyces sp. NPDC006784]|uniref:hypothetical protein n=1 Tax=Streptomyces sp. NPDC006784 TaxID=3364764 RepID=UPI0036A18C6A
MIPREQAFANARAVLDRARDRRDAVPMPAPSTTGDPVVDMLADRDALDEAMRPASDPEEWGRLADDDAWSDVSDAVSHASDPSDEEQQERRITRREACALYDEYVYDQYLKAEDECRGYLLGKRAEADGVDPVSLFSGPARIAYARASDELKEW